MEHILT